MTFIPLGVRCRMGIDSWFEPRSSVHDQCREDHFQHHDQNAVDSAVSASDAAIEKHSAGRPDSQNREFQGGLVATLPPSERGPRWRPEDQNGDHGQEWHSDMRHQLGHGVVIHAPPKCHREIGEG